MQLSASTSLHNANGAPRLPWTAPQPVVRRGQLTRGWRTLFTCGWIGALGAIGACWQAGADGGIAPWWAGPASNPQSVPIMLLPFVLTLVPLVAAIVNSRWCSLLGVTAACGLAAVATGDLADTPGLAAAQLLVAGGGLALSLASFGGRWRSAP